MGCALSAEPKVAVQKTKQLQRTLGVAPCKRTLHKLFATDDPMNVSVAPGDCNTIPWRNTQMTMRRNNISAC